MPSRLRISLANKCQILFGSAVVVILIAALAIVWVRMQRLGAEPQRAAIRMLADAWLAGRIQTGGMLTSFDQPLPGRDLTLVVIEPGEFRFLQEADTWIADAVERFESSDERREYFGIRDGQEGTTYLRYARAIRKSDLNQMRSSEGPALSASLDTTGLVDPLEKLLVIEMRSDAVADQVQINMIYIIAAGLSAGLLAIGLFWFITMRIILSPVRVLRDTAAKVAQGDLNIRADINTGDEFEQLSEVFNQMLVGLKQNQDQLKTVNKSLDLKLGRMMEHNIALDEANKIKGEFLANVSHELRTPLNSIIGFAELLQDTLRERTGPIDEKRKRYASNIIDSGRNLLELINDLLDLAKIEAGRAELRISPMSVQDTCEGLLTLIRPLAQKKNVQLKLDAEPNLPVVQTDAGKLQQIIFNFLSNAVKFTPEGGRVKLAAELADPPELHRDHEVEPPRVIDEDLDDEQLAREQAEASQSSVDIAPRHVCLSVSDTGPGIPFDMQEKIFEKFTQLDATVTRGFGGTGLGLTICRDLATLLRARIEVESVEGEGAIFHLYVPLVLEPAKTPLMPEVAEGRSA